MPWRENSILLPDGERVVAVDTRSRTVRVLSIATGESLLTFALDVKSVEFDRQEIKLALSADGRRLAACARYYKRDGGWFGNDPVQVCDVATGRRLATIQAGPSLFAFSDDSRLLAIAEGSDVRLWETASCKQVGRIVVAPPGPPLVRALAISPDGRTLATGNDDSTILLWDATLRDGAKAGALTLKQAEASWADLAGTDAARGYAAVWQLAGDPQQALAILRARVRPIEALPAEPTRSLLADLDSKEYKVRQSAERKLQELGERAEPALQQAIKTNPPLEKKRRIESLLAALKGELALEGDALRLLRAVHVLEAAGTPEARSLLESLSRGVPNARLTRNAQEALGRLRLRNAAVQRTK